MIRLRMAGLALLALVGAALSADRAKAVVGPGGLKLFCDPAVVWPAAPAAGRALSPQEKALVGTWRFVPAVFESRSAQTIQLRADGTFVRPLGGDGVLRETGTFRYDGTALTTWAGDKVKGESLFVFPWSPSSAFLDGAEHRKVSR